MTADEPVYLNAVQRGGPPAFTVADEEAREGWEWPTGESLYLQAHRDRELPGVYTLTVATPGVRCLEVAGAGAGTTLRAVRVHSRRGRDAVDRGARVTV